MTSPTARLSSGHIETIRRDSLHNIEATCDETRQMCDELVESRRHLREVHAALQSMYLWDLPDDPHGYACEYDAIIEKLAARLGFALEQPEPPALGFTPKG